MMQAILLSALLAGAAAPAAAPATDDPAPRTPRIESVVPLPAQPQEKDPAVIWYDDFSAAAKGYTESSGGLDTKEGLGGVGGSMPCIYEKGKRGTGNRKVFFGDSPAGRPVRRGESFQDVYWRIYVKHQDGWTGGSPAKMSRATSIASGRWNQAMIAHVWGSKGMFLTLDPASGVRGETVVTTQYNDFGKLKWLGNRPASKFPIHSRGESGWWVCVEARAKLNTPGQADGLNQLWIDGQLQCERKGLNWRGGYSGHGINAVFLEAYWNQGSPVTQTRWYDSFVISTAPIGPVVCPRNPTLIKTPYRGPGRQAAWEAQIATDADDPQVVWESNRLTTSGRAQADATTGRFVGPLKGQSALAPAARYRIRVREFAPDTPPADWSPWHQCFATAR